MTQATSDAGTDTVLRFSLSGNKYFHKIQVEFVIKSNKSKLFSPEHLEALLKVNKKPNHFCGEWEILMASFFGMIILLRGNIFFNVIILSIQIAEFWMNEHGIIEKITRLNVWMKKACCQFLSSLWYNEQSLKMAISKNIKRVPSSLCIENYTVYTRTSLGENKNWIINESSLNNLNK